MATLFYPFRFRLTKANRIFLPLRFLSFLFTFSTNVFKSISGFALVAVFFFITVNCITILWYEATTRQLRNSPKEQYTNVEPTY